MKKQAIFWAWVLALCLFVLGCGANVPAPTNTADIVILHTNDVHSRVDDNLGYAAVKTVKESEISAGNHVLLLDAGDALHGLPIANLSEGRDIVQIMNAVGYSAMVPGNHDFNYGTAMLLELSEEMDFPLLSCNFLKGSTPVFTGHAVFEFEGVRVGVIGVSTPETATKTNPLNVEGHTFSEADLVSVVQKSIRAAQKEGAQYIVLLTHLGLDEESKPFRTSDLVSQLTDVTVVIDGHSHTELPEGLTVQDKEGQNVLIAQTGDYLTSIGKVTIHTDGTVTAQLITEAKKDAAITDLIEDKKEAIAPKLAVVIGQSNVLLNGERDPGVRTEETNLGDLCADALRYVGNAQVALTNGGGIRTSVAPGSITYGMMNAVFPFGNTVCTLNIKGADLLKALEVGTAACPAAAGGFPQVSGMSFEIHTYLEENRVQNVMIGHEPLDPERMYTLATNDYLYIGGDGFSMLPQCEKIGEYGALDEALITYLDEQLGGTVPEAYNSSAGRIIIVTEAP
ncbi:MAG: bifunctional metallophosphatase/5'-nucleotidase [Clostridia bacterium]|nr:bifunctional metallophosphatase/5'-nucleotidase [Clostridia bacterium]